MTITKAEVSISYDIYVGPEPQNRGTKQKILLASWPHLKAHFQFLKIFGT